MINGLSAIIDAVMSQSPDEGIILMFIPGGGDPAEPDEDDQAANDPYGFREAELVGVTSGGVSGGASDAILPGINTP